MKQFLKRTTAYFLSFLLLLTTLLPAGFATERSSEGFLGAATIDCSPSVSYDAAKNEYTLQLKVDAEFYEAQKNTDPSQPKRGYFTANYDGWYLVELWGANGADGLDDGNRLGGEGGKGGYLYAKVYLTKGETLYFSLGGNGSTGYKTGQGGGANGGGGAGSSVTYGVGGGGGYSALFLFEDSAYFSQNYLDSNGNFVGDNISEYDRATKYLMIAGGGGGGGAGNGASLSGANKWTADGGNGGDIQSSITGPVTGSGTTVAGTFFAGSNGVSSGTSNSYIGKGATTVPGQTSGTIWNWSSGEKPNDWTGAYNSGKAGGAGGAGNLRGGGGGGGYCGGSGGVQESLVSPVNVGGGGGGSSFIASAANGKPVVFQTTDASNPQPEDGLTAHEMSLLDGLHSTPESGAVAITYLADAYADFSNMSSLDISFAISKYFNVTGFSFSQSRKDDAYPTGYNFTYVPQDNGETLVTLHEINLIPTEQNLRGDLNITLKFQPKNVFVGGNDVPLLAGDSITVTETGSLSRAACVIPLVKDNCYVNVPLKFTVDSLNHNYNTAKTLTPAELYGGYYDGIRGELASHFVYDFIANISSYTVEGMPAGGMEISQTTRFPVSITVTPKNDPSIRSAAGPECGVTTFTSDAVVTILEQHQGHLNGVTMNYIKSLSYNPDGTYCYTIHTTAANDRLSHLPTPDTFDENASGGGEFTVAHDGYYLVQAWGGNGQRGQDASGLGGTRQGGAGGAGGYVYAYLPLRKGDKLILAPMGQLGANPDNSSGAGGGGGTYTSIRVVYNAANYEDGQVPADIDHLVIAGGGGGGGNAIAGSWIGLLGADGNAGSASTTVNSTLQALTSYIGGTGKKGSSSGLSYTGGAGGAGAPSYYHSGDGIYRDYNAELLDKVTQAEFNSYINATTNPNTSGGGGAKITCLQLTDHSHVATDLSNYTLNLQFSKYFDIVENSLTGVNNSAAAQAAGKEALEYESTIANNLVQITAINPWQDTTSEEEGNATVYNTAIDFTFSITLRPKDAFLGGNDVPVLTEAEMSHTIDHEGETHTDTAHILLDDEADFANVRLLLTEDDLGILTGNTVHLEETTVRPVALSELYSYAGGWPNPTGEMAWTGDYVQNFVMLSLQSDPDTDLGDGPFTVDRNTYYYVTAGLYSPGPYKAKVGPVASPLTTRAEATIFVRPRIIYQLTNLTTSDKLNFENYTSLDPTTDHIATLTAADGYKLPDSISVTYNDNGAKVPCSYDSSTGRFIIPAEHIRSMTVTAAAVKQSFTVHYAYERPGSSVVTTHTETYLYGDPITHWDYYGDNITGYDFTWRWYTESALDGVAQNGDVPAFMPARDLWVIGNYSPKTYTLSVQYLYADGTQAAPPVPATEFSFGSSYSFPSPAIAGYASDKPLLSGTVDANLVSGNVSGTSVIGSSVSFLVTYTATANQLRINYIYEDTGVTEIFRTEAYKTGDEYVVNLTVPAGYTAYLENTPVTQLSGTMTATGAVYDVYYRPNTITVTFSYDKENGGNCTEDSRTVLYNSTYGYKLVDGENTFVSLPTQVLRAGHAFEGWYLDLNNPDSRVTNNTPITLTQDHTLYAKWSAKTYTLVVEHVYLNGTAAFPTTTHEIGYNEPYTVVAMEVTGHSAHILSGTEYVKQSSITEDHMPAQTVVRTFFYIPEQYPLTIRYLYGDAGSGNYNTPAAESYTATVAFGQSYSVASPTITVGDTRYECSMPHVDGIMDTVGGKVITVYYYELPPVLSVTIEWGSMLFSYERGSWNPETHRTEDGIFRISTEHANRITVKNNAESTISVDALFSYETDPYHPHVLGYLTGTNNASAAHITALNIAKNTTASAWLWLSGRMADTVSGTSTVGKCIVTLTGGG